MSPDEEEAYRAGVQAGLRGGILDDLAQDAGKPFGGRLGAFYDAGYKWGAARRYDRQAHIDPDSESEGDGSTDSPGDTGDSSFDSSAAPNASDAANPRSGASDVIGCMLFVLIGASVVLPVCRSMLSDRFVQVEAGAALSKDGGTLVVATGKGNETLRSLPYDSVSNTQKRPFMTLPKQNSFVVKTDKGAVRLRNVRRFIIDRDEGVSTFKRAEGYLLAFDHFSGQFIVHVSKSPLPANLVEGRATLLRMLGITRQDACKLEITFSTQPSVSRLVSGRRFQAFDCTK